jgi:hypothetical protein
MSYQTTCTRCERNYDEQSLESAEEPGRLCPPCHWAGREEQAPPHVQRQWLIGPLGSPKASVPFSKFDMDTLQGLTNYLKLATSDYSKRTTQNQDLLARAERLGSDIFYAMHPEKAKALQMQTESRLHRADPARQA